MKRAKKHIMIINYVMMSLLASCNAGESKTATDGFLGTFGSGTPVNLSDSMADDESAAQEIEGSVDSVISSLSDVDLQGATSLHLNLDGSNKVLLYRNCEEDGDKAVVNIVRGMRFVKERVGDLFTFKHSARALHEIKREWSKDGEAVECSENAKYAAINLDNLAGMHLEADFKRRAERESEIIRNSNEEVVRTRSRTLKIDGDRTIDFVEVSEEAEFIEISKTMTKDVSFEQEGKNSAGKLFYQKRRLKVEDENPFVIKVERSKDDGHEILARTVESGLLIAKDETDEDSSDLDYPRVESTFANVRWERDAGCMPVSGSISGEVYLDSSSTPSKTFTINFDGENTTITLPSGETTQFALGGCELDRPSTESEVSSADSAEDV